MTSRQQNFENSLKITESSEKVEMGLNIFFKICLLFRTLIKSLTFFNCHDPYLSTYSTIPQQYFHCSAVVRNLGFQHAKSISSSVVYIVPRAPVFGSPMLSTVNAQCGGSEALHIAVMNASRAIFRSKLPQRLEYVCIDLRMFSVMISSVLQHNKKKREL